MHTWNGMLFETLVITVIMNRVLHLPFETAASKPEHSTAKRGKVTVISTTANQGHPTVLGSFYIRTTLQKEMQVWGEHQI